MKTLPLPLAPPSTPVATSGAVYRQIVADGSLAGAQLRAFRVLVELAGGGPITGAELDALAQTERDPLARTMRGHLHKRLPELRACGVVVVGDARKCKITGKVARTWAVSGRLPTAPTEVRVTPATRVAQLEAEVARLQNRVRLLERQLERARQPFFVLNPQP